MFDPKKFDVKATTVQDKNGKSIQATVEINKRPVDEWEIDNTFKMAEMIRRVDPADPHYVLKVANLLKGFEHHIKGDENRAALFRTKHFTSLEQFRKFFEFRAGHSEHAAMWFKSRSPGGRLCHFYHDAKNIPPECTPVPTPDGPYKHECRCWLIDEAYTDG